MKKAEKNVEWNFHSFVEQNIIFRIEIERL